MNHYGGKNKLLCCFTQVFNPNSCRPTLFGKPVHWLKIAVVKVRLGILQWTVLFTKQN